MNEIESDELIRLRNIKRNEARLLKLGLAAPDNGKSKTFFMKSSSSKKNGGKKPAEIEKRSVLPRHTKFDRTESTAIPKGATQRASDVERSKKRKNQSESAPNSKKHKPTSDEVKKPKKHEMPSHDASLVRGAKSGCKKCTLEWQTEKSDLHSNHDKCCPWYCPSQGSKNSTADAMERTPPPPCRTDDREKTKSAADTNKTRSITPSPAVLATKPPQPLPPYITEFLSQATSDDIIPAMRGAKWMPCANPWGKVEQEEGDVVIFSPFESDGSSDLISAFHQGPNGGPPKRFAFKPMEDNSSYLQSHRSPARGGYTVLRLIRDRAALLPWGFTVKHHEFGGACLVDWVDELSPAENAVSDTILSFQHANT